MKDLWHSRAIQIHAIATFWGWLLDLASRAHCSSGDDMWSVFKCKLLCRFQFLYVENKSVQITELPSSQKNWNHHADNFAGMIFHHHPGRRGTFSCLVSALWSWVSELYRVLVFLMLTSSVFSQSRLSEKAAAHLLSQLFFVETVKDGCICFESS